MGRKLTNHLGESVGIAGIRAFSRRFSGDSRFLDEKEEAMCLGRENRLCWEVSMGSAGDGWEVDGDGF